MKLEYSIQSVNLVFINSQSPKFKYFFAKFGELLKVTMKKLIKTSIISILLMPLMSFAETSSYRPLLPGLVYFCAGMVVYIFCMYIWCLYVLNKLRLLKQSEIEARSAFQQSQSIREAIQKINDQNPYKSYSNKLLQAFESYKSVSHQISLGYWLHRKSYVAQKTFKKIMVSYKEHGKWLMKLPLHLGFLITLYFVYWILKSPYESQKMYQMLMEVFIFFIVGILSNYLMQPILYLIEKQVAERMNQFDTYIESMNDLYMATSQATKFTKQVVHEKNMGMSRVEKLGVKN